MFKHMMTYLQISWKIIGCTCTNMNIPKIQITSLYNNFVNNLKTRLVIYHVL